MIENLFLGVLIKIEVYFRKFTNKLSHINIYPKYISGVTTGPNWVKVGPVV